MTDGVRVDQVQQLMSMNVSEGHMKVKSTHWSCEAWSSCKQ
jgi:hypothetical protein